MKTSYHQTSLKCGHAFFLFLAHEHCDSGTTCNSEEQLSLNYERKFFFHLYSFALFYFLAPIIFLSISLLVPLFTTLSFPPLFFRHLLFLPLPPLSPAQCSPGALLPPFFFCCHEPIYNMSKRWCPPMAFMIHRYASGCVCGGCNYRKGEG